MQQISSTTVDEHVEIASLWIDPGRHHRLAEIIHILDPHHRRVRPIRDPRQQEPSHLQSAMRLASNYLAVRR
jgi:hypothetical protein